MILSLKGYCEIEVTGDPQGVRHRAGPRLTVAAIVVQECALCSLKARDQGGVCVGLRSLGEPSRESWGKQAKQGDLQTFLWASALVLQYGSRALREDTFPAGKLDVGKGPDKNLDYSRY